MAGNDYSIDQLSLDIDIKLKDAQTTSIKNLTSAITQLNKAVSNVANLEKYISNLNKISGKTIKIGGAGSTGKTSQTVKEKPQATYRDINETNKLKPQSFLPDWDTQIKRQMLSAEDSAKVFEDAFKKPKNDLTQTEKKVKELNKGLKNTGKEANDASGLFSKLTRSIGRIAFYRAIRTALKEVVQSFKEGLENIRSVDKSLDTSLDKISQSSTSIKNSFVSIFSGIIQRVEPTITAIADGIANVTNRINEAKAALSGATKYTKLLTSDSEEWQKQLKEVESSLFSFDKFESLTKKGSGFTGVIEADVNMDIPKAEDIIKKLTIIKDLILAVGGAIVGLGLLKLFTNLLKLKTLFSPIAVGVGSIVAGIVLLYSGIKDVINLFKNGGSTIEWFAGVLKVLAGVLAVVFGIIIMTKATTLAKTIVGLVAGVATAGALITNAIASSKKAGQDIQMMADGGVPPVGTAFIAGEAGAEAVYNMPSGKTGVANVQQLQQAFAGALEERTNPILSAIYSEIDNAETPKRSFSVSQFVNALMPEIDEYNKRRGVKV